MSNVRRVEMLEQHKSWGISKYVPEKRRREDVLMEIV